MLFFILMFLCVLLQLLITNFAYCVMHVQSLLCYPLPISLNFYVVTKRIKLPMKSIFFFSNLFFLFQLCLYFFSKGFFNIPDLYLPIGNPSGKTEIWVTLSIVNDCWLYGVRFSSKKSNNKVNFGSIHNAIVTLYIHHHSFRSTFI